MLPGSRVSECGRSTRPVLNSDILRPAGAVWRKDKAFADPGCRSRGGAGRVGARGGEGETATDITTVVRVGLCWQSWLCVCPLSKGGAFLSPFKYLVEATFPTDC